MHNHRRQILDFFTQAGLTLVPLSLPISLSLSFFLSPFFSLSLSPSPSPSPHFLFTQNNAYTEHIFHSTHNNRRRLCLCNSQKIVISSLDNRRTNNHQHCNTSVMTSCLSYQICTVYFWSITCNVDSCQRQPHSPFSNLCRCRQSHNIITQCQKVPFYSVPLCTSPTVLCQIELTHQPTHSQIFSCNTAASFTLVLEQDGFHLIKPCVFTTRFSGVNFH